MLKVGRKPPRSSITMCPRGLCYRLKAAPWVDGAAFVLHSSFNPFPQTSPCPLHKWGIPNLREYLQRRYLVQCHYQDRQFRDRKPNHTRCKCTFSYCFVFISYQFGYLYSIYNFREYRPLCFSILTVSVILSFSEGSVNTSKSNNANIIRSFAKAQDDRDIMQIIYS